MKIFRKYRTLWMMGIIVVLAILFITNFSSVLSGIGVLMASITSLLGGAALAFVLNLIMEPVERKLKSTGKPFFVKRARSLAILTSFLVMILLIVLILSIIIPNLVSALRMLTNEAPQYFAEIDSMIQKLLHNYPSLADRFKASNIDWDQTFAAIMSFIAKGSGSSNVMNSTMTFVSSFAGFFVNLFVVIVFSSYVLAEKERFVRWYYTFLDLYVSKKRRTHLTRDLRIINQSFKSFIIGEIIEAAILSTMCIVGMLILQLPYATMIGILVGVINMIPMIGAFIGGGIGAFIIFTISPTKCLIFLVFLVIIQQIESNVFFPRVIGNKVGLPGIFVMITIVVGGTLFGVAGMILGVPLMASMYKIARLNLAETQKKRDEEAKRQKEKEEQAQIYTASAHANDPAEVLPNQNQVVENVRSEVKQLRDAVSENAPEEKKLDDFVVADEKLRRMIDEMLLIYDTEVSTAAKKEAQAPKPVSKNAAAPNNPSRAQ